MAELLRTGGLPSAEAPPAPLELDPGRISTRDEAEIRVRQIRNGFWADFRPGDRQVANAHARMAVADEAFGLLGRIDLAPEQISRSTFLLIEARDRIMQSQYGHFGRASDVWADQMSARIKAYREAQERPIRLSQS